MSGAGRGLRGTGRRRRVGFNPGRSSGAGKADRAAWRPSQRLTSSARSGKAPICKGWTVSGAAGCVRSGSEDPAGSTAWSRAAGPNPIRSWPDTNPAAAASWFRSGGIAPARSATTASTRRPCCWPPGFSRRRRVKLTTVARARARLRTCAAGWTTGPGRPRQVRTPARPVRPSPAGTICSTSSTAARRTACESIPGAPM